ncbi:hypothetical protein MKZ38_009396 [Zalerion maritima]|uniref:Methyltransferase domain-containing protein n=1 Tax=Zalerion maritima TaxID=339359 RepID=A0AAD5WT00_9PEZI|nr:hypothetical protein MKZ38_009396 [Zalerion maritima]
MANYIPNFPFDPTLARHLGFLHVAVGGSRAYRKQDASPGEEKRDWDLIGIVESRDDIVSIALHGTAQLNALLGVVKVEYSSWQILNNDRNRQGWDVLRYAGWAEDSSKRSFKIWSQAHILGVTASPAACRFGVLSARVVRHTRRYHPYDGHRLFVYQPLRLAENLSILYDADFLQPDGESAAVNPGVTCDLFLTSRVIYESCSGSVDHLIAALLCKWQTISKVPIVQDIIPLLYRYHHFHDHFVRHLQTKFSKATTAIPTILSHSISTLRPHPTTPKSYVPSLESPRQPLPSPAEPRNCQRPIEFRQTSRRYHPSPFTSNSKGLLGEVCLPLEGGRWELVFVKVGPYAKDELSALSDVLRFFPRSYVQQLLGVDMEAKKLFFKLFPGRTLNEVRLDFHVNASLYGNKNRLDATDWFLEVELRRAEHVTDAYWRTMIMDSIPPECADQRIHRFYYERLRFDSRLNEFYLEAPRYGFGGRQVSISDIVNMPLVINGASHPPLRHYLDRAEAILNPHTPGGVRDLPVAFGLGDGHGGNLMVAHDSYPDILYIDYEVSGFHCPFLDMAKSIYNDGFFNVLYGDLLCDDITSKSNLSGVTVSWTVTSQVIDINYHVSIDIVGKTIAITKLEYVLRPVLERIIAYTPAKAGLAEDVLGSALLVCALLTRNFSKRPDMFFLSLAQGIRLASNLRAVFSEVFDWHMPVVDAPTAALIPARATTVQDLSLEPSTRSLRGEIIDLAGLLSSSCLTPDEVFLKRADETLQLQRHFSRADNETPGTILQRISRARYLGMKTALHTCIRESLFAESRIDHHFAYEEILESCSPDNLLVDVGCCMGTDIRKLILDGYPSKCIVGLDIETRFLHLGRILYNESESSPVAQFRQADMLHPEFANTYYDLKDKFQFVHTANVIHLFDIRGQEIFFRNLLYLVKPGGTVWGRQVGLAADHQPEHKQPDGKGYRFTMMEFRDWCLRIANWDVEDVGFEAQLVEYDELRAKREDKRWVL